MVYEKDGVRVILQDGQATIYEMGNNPRNLTPSSLVLFIRIANISTTMLNKMGDSGSPCLCLLGY